MLFNQNMHIIGINRLKKKIAEYRGIYVKLFFAM